MLRPLRDAPRRVSRARREPVPGLHRRAGLPGRRRDPGAPEPAALEDGVPAPARDPGADARRHARLVRRRRRRLAGRRGRRRRRRSGSRRRASAASPRSAPSSAGSPRVALGRMPLGLRDLAAYGLGYTAQAYAYCCCSPTAIRTPTPRRSARRGSCRRTRVRLELDDDGRRSRLTVFFRLLLAIPHFVWLALWTSRRSSQRSRTGFVALVRGRSAERAAPLPRRLRPLLRARDRVRHAGREPVPGLRRQPGLPGRHRDRPARASEPLDHAVPRLPRDPGASCLGRAQRACSSSSPSSAGSPRS